MHVPSAEPPPPFMAAVDCRHCDKSEDYCMDCIPRHPVKTVPKTMPRTSSTGYRRTLELSKEKSLVPIVNSTRTESCAELPHKIKFRRERVCSGSLGNNMDIMNIKKEKYSLSPADTVKESKGKTDRQHQQSSLRLTFVSGQSQTKHPPRSLQLLPTKANSS
ncbi:hypothetical protein MLD38_002582 [Melastoma candidum]|uniref:Uncharacterized protein n=1 Tax=Melastoma candidum TaxID=119954 RepID=A0ACB9S137_9MYRT|nr:hypothetical protein MLD38_002582 [Melastoma candidum]